MAQSVALRTVTAVNPDSRRTTEATMTVLASTDYPLLNVMWTMFAFFMWIIWIWLLITVFADLFRRRDMSGWGKAGWMFFVIVLPFLGVFIYLIAQGHKMQDRAAADAQANQQNFDTYVRSVASNGHSSASEIGHAKELLDDGAITPDEYEKIKAKALAS
jgi:hypothetical protein